MKLDKRLFAILAWTLAVVLLWANLSWAQGRGAKAQGFQGQQGPGQNAPNTPANPGNVTQ